MGTWSTSGPDANRRRSQRVILSVPVTVTGQGAKGQFTEETKTLVVNAHGALITLAAKVTQAQQLQLKSVSNPEIQDCKVVFIGPTVQGQTQIGVEFLKPAPHFWHVAFPPENWTPVSDDGERSIKAPAAGKSGAAAPVRAPASAPVKTSKA
ncbi:MAG TPA: PilZ domain-containing protein [Candidatus Acidoferrales bacterium]|nr:PilZ domain-containing protein [Candidatus Acidoferrales bacterium]